MSVSLQRYIPRVPPPVLRYWRERPDVWLQRFFGVELWTKQYEMLAAAETYKRVAVRAANDVGKSFTMACLTLHFLFNYYPCAIVTTAPTWNQVQMILWREIHKLWGRRRVPLSGVISQTQLKVSPSRFAMGLATNETERFQGFREEHTLFIIDEASGVEADIVEAIEGSLQSPHAHLIMVGNPTRLDGPFYNAFYGRESALYYKMHISAFDYINYVKRGGKYHPPLVTEQDIEEKRELWGEDSPLWAIRVLGEFPEEPPGVLIPLHLIEKARHRTLVPQGELVFGIDVADQGGDETVVTAVQGSVVLWQEAWNTRSWEESCGYIIRLIEQHKPAKVKIDYPGVGVGLYGNLVTAARNRGWKTEIIKVNPGEAATSMEEYRLVADELWYEMAKRFRAGDIDLSRLPQRDYHRLTAQLVSRLGMIDSKGLQYIEPKSALRKRGLPSPDRADSLALALYTSVRRYRNITSAQIRNLYG